MSKGDERYNVVVIGAGSAHILSENCPKMRANFFGKAQFPYGEKWRP